MKYVSLLVMLGCCICSAAHFKSDNIGLGIYFLVFIAFNYYTYEEVLKLIAEEKEFVKKYFKDKK